MKTSTLRRHTLGSARIRSTEEHHHQLPGQGSRELADLSGEGRRLLPEVRARREAGLRGPSRGHRDAGQRRSADDQLPDGPGHAGRHAGWIARDHGQPVEPRLVRDDDAQRHQERSRSEGQDDSASARSATRPTASRWPFSESSGSARAMSSGCLWEPTETDASRLW